MSQTETIIETVKRPWKIKSTLECLYVEKELTQQEIADKLGCSRQTVHNWLDRHGIDTRDTWDRHDGPWQDETTLRRLYVDQELTQQEVADKLGCSRDTVRKWFDRHGIETRDVGDTYNAGEKPWRDRETLRDAYEDASTFELADRWGCSQTTILNWLAKFDIPRRAPGQSPAREDTNA